MALPKRRLSKTRGRKRRTHDKLSVGSASHTTTRVGRPCAGGMS